MLLKVPSTHLICLRYVQSKHLWVVFYLYFGETGVSGFFKNTHARTHRANKNAVFFTLNSNLIS